ncbi:MAG: hypothetical protein F4X25_03375 [Chloroflexi bacterium]|nr:hypothetical protein [Chloroflexota bacterium]
MEFAMTATGIGALDHLGIVVADAPEAAGAFAALSGLPAPQIRDNHGEGMRARGVQYRGEPIGGGTHAAWFSLAGAAVNLMAPNGGPSPWSDHLDTLGPGACYLAFSVSDSAATLEALDALGYPTVQTGRTGGGASYGYGDAREALGVYLEILPGRAAPGGIATPDPAEDAPRLAAIGFAVADAGAAAEGWARVLGLDPPEVAGGEAVLTMEGGVELEFRTESGGGAPVIRDCTLAAPSPAGLPSNSDAEAERLLGVRFNAA